MKIALIEPKPPFNTYYFFNKELPLLGNLFLGTILKKAGHQVKVFKESVKSVYNEKTDELHPFLKQADAVGFSSITHTAKRSYQVADAIKRQFPSKKIVMGGSHPSALPEEALQHADQVVVKEGEYVVRDIFEGRINDPIVHGPLININDVPAIDLSLLEGYRYKNGKINLKFAPILASRGCPFDCNFCSVSWMFGKKYRVKDPDLVMEEVMMRYNEGFRTSFFYDDNFAAQRTKTKVFLEKLIRANLDFRWSSQFRVDVAKDRQLVKLLKRANCTTLFIGVESINPKALQDYNKHQTVEEIKQCISILKEEGMHVHSMFILGADSDDEETIEETIKFSKYSQSNTAQFSILFPIPGTQLYQEMKQKNRIFINDWNYFDGSHSVILPKRITPYKLQKKFIHGYLYFYRKNLLGWLISRAGFLLWKISNRKYMSYLKYFTRKLKKQGVIKDGVLTLKGLQTDSMPTALSKSWLKKHIKVVN
ncbi:MAG: B12-binding domain-containing radical SAM protein [Spirochaetota bacterium]